MEFEETRKNDIQEMVGEAGRKYVDAIKGIKVLFGIHLDSIDFHLEDYDGIDYKIYFENLGKTNAKKE